MLHKARKGERHGTNRLGLPERRGFVSDLGGDFNHISSQQLLQALRKLVGTSLKCFADDSPVAFTFKTHGKVDFKKKGMFNPGGHDRLV